MEIGKQIRKYRTELQLSQDALAEKVYVTRQTISNWENDRCYPDVKSLVLLSDVFGISLDILIKGDLVQMKKEINAEDVHKFKRDNVVVFVLLVGVIVLPIPLLYWLKLWGILPWLAWSGLALWRSWHLEKFKKSKDIITYKEIIAFVEGKQLSENEKHQEIGKRPYQNILFVAATAIVGLIVVLVLRKILFGF